MSARAALDAARAVFAISRRQPSDRVSVPLTNTGDATDLSSPRARATALWQSAASVLQAALVRSDLGGQALIGEARRLNQLSLSDAHTLVALHGWSETQQDAPNADAPAPATNTEQTLANDTWLALERLVVNSEHAASQSSAGIGANVGAAPSWAPPPTPQPPPAPSATFPPPPPPSPFSAREPVREPVHKRGVGPATIVVSLLVVVAAAVGFWYWNSQRASRDYADGVAAFQRGAIETAQRAFARAAQSDPNDARPLVYLGRIARDQRDFAASRNFLDAAVRTDPQNAVARREYGSTLLAEGRSELARRFYVRALELNPNDTLSQGYLACALHRLGRADEATRWSQRAGAGSWTPCLNAPAPAPSSSSTPP